jgi:uncharacterized membrane protein
MPGVPDRKNARRLAAIRITGGVILVGLAVLVHWATAGPLAGQTDDVIPWAVTPLPTLLRLTEAWLVFLGIIVILSAARPSLSLSRGSWRKPVPTEGESPADLSRGTTLEGSHIQDSRIRLTQSAAAIILAAMIAVFVLAYGWLAVTKHLRFNSTAYDLGIGAQAIWNTAHGHPFATSLEVDNYLADHFGPSLLLIVPIYAVWPSPSVLVVLQALVVGLAAIPLHRLARRRLTSATLALMVAAVYLLYSGTGFLLRFDVHFEFLAILAFLAAFDAMDEGRWKFATLWLLLALGCKEDMGLAVAACGLYALIVRRKATWGTAWLVIGVATFALASFWLIPLLRGESSDTLARFEWLGSSPGEMVKGLVTNPGRVWSHVAHPRQLTYALQILLPVGYLALLSPWALLLAAPALALNLLSDSWPQSTIYFQYTAVVIPVVFISATLGIARLRQVLGSERGQRIVTLALVPLALSVFLINNPFRELDPLPSVWARLPNAEAVTRGLQMIPPGASVVTTNHYAPHLANRRSLYVIGPVSPRIAPSDPDVVFFNLGDDRFAGPDEYRAYLQRLDPERYGLVFSSDGVVVMERDNGSREAFKQLLAQWRQPE